MKKIGITGGIGSGKTTVCRVFQTLGIPVFYADEAARSVMIKDQELMCGLKQEFGSESYFNDGSLNRAHIAGIVFHDADRLAKLNALVHPAVFRAFDQWCADLPVGFPYVLKEAALLFESGSASMCDENIVVVSPVQLKLERVMKRDNTNTEEIMARMSKQLPDDKKAELADHVIVNDENESLIAQVVRLHHRYLD
ncbi:dephospho-CoA kinase [Pedobacter deserti]|uniref:dephospho-CoA kinase n=1 Tax=Pedobacter deserti TaxID=2817382 RepID=UPI002108E004|nr:dephospho-CoA kinase [Pedobacter sp. SYSU D00382]